MVIYIYREPVVIENFITPKECEYLINMSKEKLIPATLFGVNRDTITKKNDNTERHSYTHDIVDTTLPVYEKIKQQIQNHVDMKGKHIETLHVVKYESGGYYLPHFDSSGTGSIVSRPYTFLIYLNEGYGGGETKFNVINKTYKLKVGDALFFHNHDSSGDTSGSSRHSGESVTSGIKWVCNVWIRT